MDILSLPKWMWQTTAILIMILLALLAMNQYKNLCAPPQTMRVSAEGRITGVPDVAIVTLGVSSQGSNPVETKNSNNQKINQILAFIKQQGIADKDIQTTGLNASPRYNYANGQNTIVGYQADQTITVKVMNVDKSQTQLEGILDGVVNNGANEIQGVNFNFADSEMPRQLARKQAIEKAIAKAKELTETANLKLGKIVNIIENPNGFANPAPFAAVSFSARAKSVAPNIEPGSQEIVEPITLIFNVY